MFCVELILTFVLKDAELRGAARHVSGAAAGVGGLEKKRGKELSVVRTYVVVFIAQSITQHRKESK